jgi:hypothetical protein
VRGRERERERERASEEVIRKYGFCGSDSERSRLGGREGIKTKGRQTDEKLW